MKRKTLRPGEKIPVLLTYEERDLIQNETMYSECFAALALVVGDQLQVFMTPDDLEDLLDYISEAADRAKNRETEEKFDILLDKLVDLLSPS